jgi:epoxyqueuosine reductase
VRGAAVWALGRLVPKDRFVAVAATRAAHEADAAVADEWAANLLDSDRQS